MAQTTISSRPLGRGKFAADHLESVGLMARVPTLRSSDFNYPCEFSYYLERRLGLSPAFSEQCSAAMCRGSWHHTRLEVVDAEPPAIRAHMDRALATRIVEIKMTAEALGMADSYASRMVETARDDRDAAWERPRAGRIPARGSGCSKQCVGLDCAPIAGMGAARGQARTQNHRRREGENGVCTPQK